MDDKALNKLIADFRHIYGNWPKFCSDETVEDRLANMTRENHFPDAEKVLKKYYE